MQPSLLHKDTENTVRGCCEITATRLCNHVLLLSEQSLRDRNICSPREVAASYNILNSVHTTCGMTLEEVNSLDSRVNSKIQIRSLEGPSVPSGPACSEMCVFLHRRQFGVIQVYQRHASPTESSQPLSSKTFVCLGWSGFETKFRVFPNSSLREKSYQVVT